jgi:hypothetical protein
MVIDATIEGSADNHEKLLTGLALVMQVQSF